MKKICLILGLLLMTSGISHASVCDNFTCPANPYGNSLGFSNITGINFLSEKIGNLVLSNAIKKDSKGKYRVNLQSYNVTALKKGIFKSLEVTGKNTITDGIYISNLKLKTLCDYNYIEVDNKHKTTFFREPLALAYEMQISEDDLNKTMESSKYKDMIRRINSIGNTFKIFNVSSSSVKIENNKLYYVMQVSVPLLKTKPNIVIESDLSASNGNIVLNEANLVTDAFKIDMTKLEKIINYLNLLEFELGIFEGKQATTSVDEIIIQNNIVNISGKMLIDKDVVLEQ
jgi:hypothetical protein